jgi:predicted GNAT family N-acyltransferase
VGLLDDGQEYLRRSGRNLAAGGEGLLQWLSGGAQAGAEPLMGLLRGDAIDQPFLPTSDSGGRVGAIASALGSTVMPVAAPTGALGAGPVMRGTNAAPGAARGLAEQVTERIAQSYPDVSLALSGSDRGLTLGKVVVPKDARGAGTGSAVMREILGAADEAGMPVMLSPSSDFGGSVSRLKQFYKRFGFVENKGRNRDFEISESMYREPGK